MRVIIIAAGMGTRLRPHTEILPKCLLDVGGKTILERTVSVFKRFGFDEIGVVRGYKKNRISFDGFSYFDNKDYENNNILHSLFSAEQYMDKGFISSYSDIIYHHSVVKKLLASRSDISIVVDTDWRRGYKGRTKHPISEAELVSVNRYNNVVKIGKDIVTPNQSHGEFIGLAKFSKKGAHILLDIFNKLRQKYNRQVNQRFQNAKEFKKAYLTDMFQELVDRGHAVKSVDIRGRWTEIDTTQDLLRARKIWAGKK